MGQTTNIDWTDATFNPWWGCTKVSPACDNCYAAALDRRTGGDYWAGTHKTLSENNWKGPFSWDRKAAKAGIRTKVFSGSMCDVFDNKADPTLRQRLFQTIRATPNLDWQLLTKRAPNIAKMLPADWGNGWANVWLGVTCEDVAHGLPRIEHLRKVPAVVRFLSIEPLLQDLGQIDLTGIHWVIVGGESGPGYRPLNPQWAESIRSQCAEQSVSFFFKQAGGFRGGDDLLNGHSYKSFPIVREVLQ